ncbi:MAG: hypothetical protein B7733_25795 [Myxococcales bacterium FL481]|nr:MAG: hypothetical protein B7733_25795 [Myxococcales bacterium FL481]
MPKSSGKYVYSASATTHRVAVIDTSSLRIDVIDAGRTPTAVAPMIPANDQSGAVAVLSHGSDQVALIRTPPSSGSEVRLVDITADANQLAVSPDGRMVIAYHDVDIKPELPPSSDQELSVVLADDPERTYAFSVGAHPRDVVFNAASSRAYVTTDDGVNVLDLDSLDGMDKPPLVVVTEETGLDPTTVEVQIAAEANLAIARVQDEKMLLATDLASGSQFRVDLPGYPTDVDIADDGSFVIATVPGKTRSRIIELRLPATSPDDVREFEVAGGEYVGVTALAPSGDAMLLYTTVDPWAEDDDADDHPDPRKRMTIARRVGRDWADFISLYTEIPIRAVGIAPDSGNAILLHDEAPDLNPAAPWPYTLLDLRAQVPLKKLQHVEAKPSSFLFTPDGDRSVVLVRDDALGVQRADLIDLGNFIVANVPLGSPPEGAGYVGATDKIFISQAHRSGRLSFIDDTGAIETATGFELNDSIKD